ncbi:helix-turn-helix transcriptional regulator [Leclercia sp. LSNIH6]|uniref:helix-turn-helix transcriptional regulator n=1 Tax=Leclercia sp. EC_58 TaxID=2584090 RepID=UPI000CDDDF38|nr:LuxR C-terminal-related transcriptional regulator [Leclercia sp. EC_58]MBW9399622.1 helix-turn-helix transcriptional regulator [Leclercia sp. EC_58]POU75300.1 helix-turn-helix transcriptional regulator [Leclercia sp. LSNIH7]POU77613.1 helix-turn-helix transcriptional regulator [Leclercia sp. LSNIH6]POW50192.1 helix-turn-helix transcriptional regulator [Leclercia sp. LSNIH8]
MFKILLIDRCHYTRKGLEMWINHSGLFPSPVLVTGLNNLFLAREHILQWKPTLVIADFQGFTSDIQHIQQLSSVINASKTVPFISLHSDEHPEMSAFMDTFPLWASLSKTAPLDVLAQTINAALAAQEVSGPGPAATPLLTRQEEKVLMLWMDGASNHIIASKLRIHGKTVYTYKRNIRMKLHMDTRYSPFLSLP